MAIDVGRVRDIVWGCHIVLPLTKKRKLTKSYMLHT